MKTEAFMRNIMDLDFDNLVGEENVEAFATFVKEQMENQADQIILRFLFEKNVDEGEIPLPYYMWAVYPMDADGGIGGTLQIIPPDFDNPMSFLEQKFDTFFEIVVED